MNYSFLRESRVVVMYQGRAFEFDALSDISATLDYEEYKTTRKTLHKRRNYPISRIVAKNPSNISLAVNITDNFLEKNFFRWLGMKEYNGLLYLPFFASNFEPEYVDIYIISAGIIFYIKSCFVSTIDFTLDKSLPLLNISIEGADCSIVGSSPLSSSNTQGNVLPYSPLRVIINNNEMPAVIGTGISFQQQCSWRNTRTIHNISTIYTNKTAIVNEMNVSATINFNLVNRFKPASLMDEIPIMEAPVTIFNQYINIDFPNCRITKRLNVADIYSVSYDLVPLESANDPVTIKFYGENE